MERPQWLCGGRAEPGRAEGRTALRKREKRTRLYLLILFWLRHALTTEYRADNSRTPFNRPMYFISCLLGFLVLLFAVSCFADYFAPATPPDALLSDHQPITTFFLYYILLFFPPFLLFSVFHWCVRQKYIFQATNCFQFHLTVVNHFL